jgi:hypothetical protein
VGGDRGWAVSAKGAACAKVQWVHASKEKPRSKAESPLGKGEKKISVKSHVTPGSHEEFSKVRSARLGFI